MATITRSVSQSFTPSESLSITVSIWAYVNSHSDTLSTTDSGLSRSTSTWRNVITLSDSFSNAESLSRTVSTYRTDVTLSDSFSNSESLSRAVDTWRHIISYNMSLASSESLSRSTDTWRHITTASDTLSSSDSVSLNVTTWQFILSNSDSVSPSESLNVGVSLWRHIHTNTDSTNITDSVNAQISLAEDTYYYDNYDTTNATKLVGVISSSNFTSDSSKIDHIVSLTDSSIDTPTTFKTSSSDACVVYDLSSQQNVNFIAVYVKEILSTPIKIYGSNSQGSGYTLITQVSGSSNSWNVTELSTQNYRYYAFQIEQSGSDTLVNELYFGKSFKPEIRYGLGSATARDSGNVIKESYTGIEYLHRLQDEETKITNKYDNISSSLKTEFENLSVKSNHKKLLYNKDGLHYLLPKPIQFSEIAYNRYSTQVVLTT